MSSLIQLCPPSNTIIGCGSSEAIGEVAKSYELTRALIVTDTYLLENGPVEKLMQLLQAAGIDTEVYDGVQPDPTVKNVNDGLSVLREHGADGVVAIGRGGVSQPPWVYTLENTSIA